jgi:hypothetical protein
MKEKGSEKGRGETGSQTVCEALEYASKLMKMLVREGK